MKVEIIPCLSDNFSYLIHDKESDKVSIVDPAEYKACDNVIKKYKKLDFILNTHHHADHVDGNLELKKKYNSKILGFELQLFFVNSGIPNCVLHNPFLTTPYLYHLKSLKTLEFLIYSTITIYS